MTERHVHLPVAAQESVQDFVDQAVKAEELGYDFVWLPETWGRDAVTIMTSIAHATEEIGIGSSIMNVYSRSPALLAQTAATLQEVSDGRFRLGIGPSGPAVIGGWHGEDFGNPLRRTREYVDIIKMVLAGEELDYNGEYFNVSGFRLRCDAPEPAPSVDVAGMGPKAVELAGRFADGWHAILFTPETMRDRLEDFERGGEMGDRDRSQQQCTLSLTCCALEDGEEARELTRQHSAFYVGAMGTYYRDSLARQGYEEEAHAIAANWMNGDREEALEIFTDEMLDDFTAAGTPERASDELQKFADIEGVDTVSVGFPRAATQEQIHATLEALAPDA
ncbi:TIGR04024 family LLM class F420-dependent oxidoreductase [Haloarchaeobius sp. HME9146]|uniref:TIGR04024 family LLM class F420-dependent oxidoreductase n=1 Tax=Haloarchaeobius sp. HME9146 TaxID=2978732 RepID=UPI0021BE0F18|nr:TIGR04024 family LLM class F420-dependent oxidoreductase [Haloarchaeobius sp. HME9146]MCT9097272.1 TIGR04024 family LLM class F420-dependent oxidoreductase [Haloarchaeobius sp. HME9146]